MDELEAFTFELPEESEILPDGRRWLLEQTVTHRGIWRVHKADADTIFPSDLHADRVDEPEKLDLYTGRVYSKTTRQHLYSLSKKSMRFIHQTLSSSKEPEILTRLSKTERFTYLN